MAAFVERVESGAWQFGLGPESENGININGHASGSGSGMSNGVGGTGNNSNNNGARTHDPGYIPDLGPLVGRKRGFRTRERIPHSGGMGGMEREVEQEEGVYAHGQSVRGRQMLSPTDEGVLRRRGKGAGKGKERERESAVVGEDVDVEMEMGDAEEDGGGACFSFFFRSVFVCFIFWGRCFGVVDIFYFVASESGVF